MTSQLYLQVCPNKYCYSDVRLNFYKRVKGQLPMWDGLCPKCGAYVSLAMSLPEQEALADSPRVRDLRRKLLKEVTA